MTHESLAITPIVINRFFIGNKNGHIIIKNHLLKAKDG